MIQGRSALTERCKQVLNLIDSEVRIDMQALRAKLGRVEIHRYLGLLEERGFIARHGDIIISLSATPDTQGRSGIPTSNVHPIASHRTPRAVNGCPLSQGGLS